VHVPFLDLDAAYRELEEEIDDAARRVPGSGRFILGAEVEQCDLPVRHPLGELDAAHGELLTLPMGRHLSDAQVDHVIDAVLRFGDTLRVFPSRHWATGTSAP
jgi:hypothetical protein